MRPKTHAHIFARPRSANTVLIAVRRVFALRGIATPPAAETKRVLHCLEKAFVAKLGPAALLPTRKGPLTADMLVSILSIESFQVHGSAFSWSSGDGAAIRCLFLVMWRTGMRKDDAIRLRADSVTLRPDSGCNVRPATTKADQLAKCGAPI
jgi:integrase